MRINFLLISSKQDFIRHSYPKISYKAFIFLQDFYNMVFVYTTKRRTRLVFNILIEEPEKAMPYGVYDIEANEDYVGIGISVNTADLFGLFHGESNRSRKRR